MLSLSDVDSATLTGATVKIAGNFHSDQDELGFVDQNGISGIYNAATGVLTLTGSSSVANYQAALRSVTYFNASDDPSTEQRIITFQASDGSAENHLSDLATATINITLGDNKSPVAHDDSNAITEEASPNNVGGNVLHNDADADSDTLSVTAVDGTAVDVVDGIVIAGEYGILHVGADGAYDYALDHSIRCPDDLAKTIPTSRCSTTPLPTVSAPRTPAR